MKKTEEKQKPGMKRISVKIGDAQIPHVERIQWHYGHQTISETVRYLVVQGINAEVARMAQAQGPENMEILKEFTDVIRQLSENPNLPGLLADMEE
jgi:hypothetical protein